MHSCARVHVGVHTCVHTCVHARVRVRVRVHARVRVHVCDVGCPHRHVPLLCRLVSAGEARHQALGVVGGAALQGGEGQAQRQGSSEARRPSAGGAGASQARYAVRQPCQRLYACGIWRAGLCFRYFSAVGDGASDFEKPCRLDAWHAQRLRMPQCPAHHNCCHTTPAACLEVDAVVGGLGQRGQLLAGRRRPHEAAPAALRHAKAARRQHAHPHLQRAWFTQMY